MGALLVSDVLASARKILGDEGSDRWTDTDLLAWLNAGVRAIIGVKPAAGSKKAVVTLVAGVEQSLPADGVQLLNVPNNAGTSKRSITLIETDALNAVDPNWRDSDPTGEAIHYTFDEDDPLSFEIYPPAIAGQKVRVLYAALPAVVGLTDTNPLDDSYESPLVDFVVYRASLEPSDSTADAQRAANAISTFMQALTGKAQAQAETKPQRK